VKIVLVSTADIHGGAAISCYRLLQALNKYGANVKALVQRKTSTSSLVETTTNSRIKVWINFYRFAFERFIFFLSEKSKAVRFSFSLGNVGEEIYSRSLIKQADLINLHWINMGFLSIKSIKNLIALNKPIVWTLHDMWAFTGGCHYVGECRRFQNTCGQCPFVRNSSNHDLSTRVYKKKKKLFENNKEKIMFVTSSHWLADEAKKSSLLRGFRIESIPIPVDTKLFRLLDKQVIRGKYGFDNDHLYLLFGAMNINDSRKGFSFFIEALSVIKIKFPTLANILHLVIFGKSTPEALSQIPFPLLDLHFISSQEKLVEVFNAVDLFVIPSLEDNLPNIIMESMACGTPVVGFNTGGIPQLIDHLKTGYLAQYKSANDLADGIFWCLTKADRKEISVQSRNKALNQYSEEVVAKQYLSLFEEVYNLNK
jgi:glycosyltransferase involved in cell wall biosynthesis